jgi:hypothetical protein
MPITFYNECEALQIPSGSNGADGLSAVSAVKDSTTTIPASGSTTTLFASAVGTFGYEWLKAGVFFNMPGYGVYEVTAEGAATATEKQITYRNNGTAGNVPTTVVPTGTLIVPAGPPGGNGTNGATVLNGALAPTSGQGNNGDFFINTATSTIYGPKAAGAWPTGVSLIGATGNTGPAGSALLSLVPSAPTAKATLVSTSTLTNGTAVSLFSSTTGINIPAVTMALYDKVRVTYQGRVVCNNLQVKPSGNGASITHFLDFVQDPAGSATVTSLSNPNSSTWVIPSTLNGSMFENRLIYKIDTGAPNDLAKFAVLFYKMVIEVSRVDVTSAAADAYRVSVVYNCWGNGVEQNGYSATNYQFVPFTSSTSGWAEEAIRIVPYISRVSDVGTTSHTVDSTNMANVEFFKVV